MTRLKFAARHQLPDQPELREEPQDVGHHQPQAALLRLRHHAVRPPQVEGDGLLEKDVLARRQGRQGPVVVQGRGQADVHEVDAVVGEQVLDAVVRGHPPQVVHAAVVAEVPLHPAPVAPQLLRVPGADGGHLRPFDPGDGLVVGGAHETDADDADAYHGFSPLGAATIAGPRKRCQGRSWRLWFPAPVSSPALPRCPCAPGPRPHRMGQAGCRAAFLTCAPACPSLESCLRETSGGATTTGTALHRRRGRRWSR